MIKSNHWGKKYEVLSAKSRKTKEEKKEIAEIPTKIKSLFTDIEKLKEESLSATASPRTPEEEIKKKIASGYTGGNYNICPDSVINDVSRLEVLIGGKRAGNNSPEIINEAADICQRLFQHSVIDSHIYRELIDELIDSD